MKTFRELIAWELEQDQKERRPAFSAEQGASKIADSMARKLRYLSSNMSSNDRDLSHSLGAA